jgi:hypothetical protein
MKLLYIGLLLLAVQCKQVTSNHFEQKEILGEWILTENQINYPSLQFNIDSSAVFRSRADTIYRFQYIIKGDSLILKDINNKETLNRIKILDKSKLVFYNLLEHDKEQVYKKQ